MPNGRWPHERVDLAVTPPLEPKALRLRAKLAEPGTARAAGAWDALSAGLGERAGFDALWASGLAISAANGVSDSGIVGAAEVIAAADIVNRASGLPVVVDGDSGFGDVNALVRTIRLCEARGLAGLSIEDQAFPKRNSFHGEQRLADPDEFAVKIESAKAALRDDAFVVIARVQSLIAGTGQADALWRAELYADAGADAILIHSRGRTPDEVLEFARAWRRRGRDTPLIAVPTSYPQVTVDELREAGIGMAIYANQALRAAVLAMSRALAAIASAGSSGGVESDLVSVQELLDLIGTGEVEQRDAWFHSSVAARRERGVEPAPPSVVT